jgi:hypothetical protein
MVVRATELPDPKTLLNTPSTMTTTPGMALMSVTMGIGMRHQETSVQDRCLARLDPGVRRDALNCGCPPGDGCS